MDSYKKHCIRTHAINSSLLKLRSAILDQYANTPQLRIGANFSSQNLKETSENEILQSPQQRWSPRGRPWPRGRPRGQILKSLALALASKVKSLALALASRPQVLENWPVLGSRTALFFGKLKFCGAVEKFFGKRFFVEIA